MRLTVAVQHNHWNQDKRLRIKRSLYMRQVPLAFWLLILLAIPSCTSMSGVALPGGGDSHNLEQWLRLAYVETEYRAGFGDYPAELLKQPTLYSTSSAVAILLTLGVPIFDVESVVDWVETLRLENGLYDDPMEGAPILFETEWALATLRHLGATSAQAQRLQDTLLDMIESDGLASPVYDGEDPTFSARLHELWQIVRCLREMDVLQDMSVRAALQLSLDRCLGLLDEQRTPGEWQPWSEDDTSGLVRTCTKIICAIDAAQLPSRFIDFLDQQLAAIAFAPIDFTGSGRICDVLDVAAEVHGWTTIPEYVAATIREYLTVNVQQSLGPLGAFGWTRSWGAWIDPHMNVRYVELHQRVKQPYSNQQALLDAFDSARIEGGWVRMVLCGPSQDYSYFGLSMARFIGSTAFSEEKLAANAMKAIEDSDSSLQDLLYAARTLKAVGRFKDEERAEIARAIDRMFSRDLFEGAYWLVRLVYEAELAPTGTLLVILEDRLLADIEQTQIRNSVLLLRELAWLQAILGASASESQALIDALLELEGPTGGFFVRQEAPFADMLSTLAALEALSVLGAVEQISAARCLDWLEHCFVGPGYLLATREDVAATSTDEEYADSYATYMAVRIRELLAAGS